jgi:hypothetical protein
MDNINRYKAPYAPNNFSMKSQEKLHAKTVTGQKGKKKSTLTSIVGGLLIMMFLYVGGTTIYRHLSQDSNIKAKSPIADALDLKDKKFLDPKATEMKKERVMTISEELATRIYNHSNLPLSRGINIAWIEETQKTNQDAMDSLLEKLSIEIGSSEALGILRTIKENRQEIAYQHSLTQSLDPQIAQNAKQRVAHLKMELDVLTAKLSEAYDKEGLDLTEEQVKSLTRSPHGEEASYLINGFQNIKTICFEMENRLRKFPTEEMARKYYGTYHVLLLALDKIQKNTIDKIYLLHLPEARWVIDEANNTKSKALRLLEDQAARNSLSTNQKSALQFNIQSCDRTITKAMKTERKLEQSLKGLEASNQKLQYSIAAAENSHTAMLLHTEISRIGEEHLQEIEELKEITLPDMVAADFSDMDDPWLSPVEINGLN